MLTFNKLLKKLLDFKVLLYNTGIKSFRPNIYNLNPSVFAPHCCFSTEKSLEQFPLQEICNLDVSHLKCDLGKWHEVSDEILRAKARGDKLPEYLKLEHLTELLKCDTRSQRSKYLKFLFLKEKIKLKDEKKRCKKRTEPTGVTTENVLNHDHICYGLGNNTLILRTTRRSIVNFYKQRLANSVLFGQKMVIDLGYDEFMTCKERRHCAIQVNLLSALNRQNLEPYNLYLCNARAESQCVQFLCQLIPNIDKSLTTLTEHSYLDLFPKEKLVYLSPHASETLKTYDHQAIYIIGGFVDTVKRNHISLFKSQEEGIKSYSLPLDEYVSWGCGSRSLSINQVFSIMQTLRDTGDWKQAFKHIPARKLKKLEVDSDEAKCMPDKLLVLRN